MRRTRQPGQPMSLGRCPGTTTTTAAWSSRAAYQPTWPRPSWPPWPPWTPWNPPNQFQVKQVGGIPSPALISGPVPTSAGPTPWWPWPSRPWRPVPTPARSATRWSCTSMMMCWAGKVPPVIARSKMVRPWPLRWPGVWPVTRPQGGRPGPWPFSPRPGPAHPSGLGRPAKGSLAKRPGLSIPGL